VVKCCIQSHTHTPARYLLAMVTNLETFGTVLVGVTTSEGAGSPGTILTEAS
jgi:hypothetical protein